MTSAHPHSSRFCIYQQPGAACSRSGGCSDLNTESRAMAPLSLPLSSLLKHRDCLQRASVFCNVFQGSARLAPRSRLWKRDFRAVARGAGQLQFRRSGTKNYAASASGSSTDGRDVTERLWSVYNETKKQTEGMSTVSVPALTWKNPREAYNCGGF